MFGSELELFSVVAGQGFQLVKTFKLPKRGDADMFNSKHEDFEFLDSQRRIFHVVQTFTTTLLIVTVVAIALYTAPAYADSIPLGAASSFAVLYDGVGGHNFQIQNNAIINGNVGVGGTGMVQFNGPGAINGALDFSAANTNPHQFQRNNNGTVGPTSVNYSDSAVTAALSAVDSLSSSLAGLGNSLAISGNQTVNESAGQLDTVNGVTYRVFNVTSYNENNGMVLTLNGDGSGDPVVFNIGINGVNLSGDVTLNSLTDDQVLWNFTTSGQNAQLQNNNNGAPGAAFQGVILAPNDQIQLNNAILDGRVFGGGVNQDMQIQQSTINAPPSVPEPSTLPMFAFGLAGLGLVVRQRQSMH